jgi:hypothetical protein
MTLNIYSKLYTFIYYYLIFWYTIFTYNIFLKYTFFICNLSIKNTKKYTFFLYDLYYNYLGFYYNITVTQIWQNNGSNKKLYNCLLAQIHNYKLQYN